MEVKLPTLLGNYDRPTNRPTDGQTGCFTSNITARKQINHYLPFMKKNIQYCEVKKYRCERDGQNEGMKENVG